jgi:peptidoglycan/LPS O-acetylase OafA/YrhL
MSTKLSAFSGRDNNFNLIRFLAATLVIWSHAFRLLDHPHLELVYRVFGLGAGDFGVDVFFVLSGFLVSKSLDGKTLAEFVWARCMRIYPALWVSIAASVLVAALVFSDEPATRFLTSRATVTYLMHNATLLPTVGAQPTLPHAFAHEGSRFNVSLWTLPYELQMYGLLAVLGMTFGVRARYVGALAALGATGLLLHQLGLAGSPTAVYGRFLYLFFAGALAYTLRGRIVLRTWLAIGLIGAIAATIAVAQRYSLRQAVLLLALPYLLLWLGLVPGGPLRLWNRLGDYSYGMYIYACPVQIALFSTGAAVTAEGNFLLCMLITLPMAMTSWHAVEKRALRRPLPAFLTYTPARRAPTAAD